MKKDKATQFLYMVRVVSEDAFNLEINFPF